MQAIKTVQIEPSCLADADGPFADVQPAVAELLQMGVVVITAEAQVADPAATLYITSSKAGLEAAKARGLIPILLMQDPDEAMKLTKLEPAGGIVSLLELPDFIRFVAAQKAVVQS
jgi:beta-phosphoglucomutase-like phosphatase (HAD superfamily)